MGAPDSPIEKPTFTDLLRVWTRPIIDPVVTILAKLGISPNALTVIGMLTHALFAFLIANGEMRWAAVAIMLISPLDALDGALARKLGTTSSSFGAFLDSTLDRIAEIILFAGFILYYVLQDNTTMLAISYVAISGSLMVSYARARAEALDLSCKVGILGRVERYIVLSVTLFFNIPNVGLIVLAVFAYITVAQRMHHVWKQTGRI